MKLGIWQLALMAVVALLCVQPAAAIIVRETCANATHAQDDAVFSLEETGVLSNFTHYQLHPCLNGCSYTFGRCRWDGFESAIWLAGVLGFMIAASVAGIRRSGPYSIIAAMLLLTVGLMVLLTDVFAGYARLLLTLTALAMVVLNVDEYTEHARRAAESDDED